MEDKMIKKINAELKRMYKEAEMTTREHTELKRRKIEGMIEMLELVAGKEYCYDENGLKEM